MTDTAPLTNRLPVNEASPNPCSDCPWRLANQGKKNGMGWYSKANLQRLWSGLRRGERMTCHPTDPRMRDLGLAVSEQAKTTECTGSLILVQRELMVFQRDYNNLPTYKRSRPRGMTRNGFLALVSRAIPFPGEIPMAKPNLNNMEVGYPPLGEWAAMTETEYEAIAGGQAGTTRGAPR